MARSADNPGVIVLPPLLYGGAFVLVLLLRWVWPLSISNSSATFWPGIALLVVGIAIAVWGRRTMEQAGTNISPSLPAKVIVTSGPFRSSRNPLYIALTLVYLGLTLAFNTWWGIVLLVPVLVIMHWGVVLREERYLEEKFSDSYQQYRSKVRRYL